jgi:hypothetical protein
METDSNVISILLDLEYRERVPLEQVDIEKISINLLRMGIEYILLQGSLLDQFDGGIAILVKDDDLDNIIGSYSYSEENLLGNNSY